MVAESPEISTRLETFPNQSCCQHRLLLRMDIIMFGVTCLFVGECLPIMFRSLHGFLGFFSVVFQGKNKFTPRETLGYKLHFQCVLPLGIVLALDLSNSCNDEAGL